MSVKKYYMNKMRYNVINIKNFLSVSILSESSQKFENLKILPIIITLSSSNYQGKKQKSIDIKNTYRFSTRIKIFE